MKEVIVVEEYLKEDSSLIIAIADKMDIAIDLMHEYYGQKLEIEEIEDVRGSGIEYVYTVELESETITIVFSSFNLNKL